MQKNNDNFQTRIIEGGRKQKEEKVKNALAKYCENSPISLTLELPSGKLKLMDIDVEETQRIIADEKLKQSINTQNGIFCAKFIGAVFGAAILLYICAKLWEWAN